MDMKIDFTMVNVELLTIALNPTKTARGGFSRIARYQDVNVVLTLVLPLRARSWRVSAGVR